MKTANDLYYKVNEINRQVKENLKSRGIVVPIQRNENTIQIGFYLIRKISQGNYNIVDYKDRIIIEGINLPQTAVILANKLALGKWIDTQLLQTDRKYGYALFDELVHVRSYKNDLKKKNFDRAEIMENKSIVANRKKEYYKKAIMNDFRKLIDLR